MPRAKLIDSLFPKSKSPTPSHRKLRLLACLPSIHSRIEIDGLSVLDAWREEAANQCIYKYSQFAALHAIWRSERGLGRTSRAKGRLITVPTTDYAVLKSWQRSQDRRKWEVSVALLGLSSCHTVSEICHKIGRAKRTVEKWCVTYEQVGIDGLPVKRSRKLSEKSQTAIKEKKERLIKIIHQTPNAHDINRASWSLQALSEKAHPVVPGLSISTASGSHPERGWVRPFRGPLIGLPACRSLSCGAVAGAGLSARLCGDCRARRYPSNSSVHGARRARASFRTRRAGRSADCIGRQTR